MQYLLQDMYEKACSSGEKADDDKWQECYKAYYEEFNKIKQRLPKLFLREYEKKDFHDNIINSFHIYRRSLNNSYKYDIVMDVLEYPGDRIQHTLIFKNVDHLKMNFIFSFAGTFDWIYSEILPVDEKHMSLEILLFEGSLLYFEFSKLQYRKTKIL